MVISNAENCPRNGIFDFYPSFFPLFEPNGPVNLWKRTSASKYLTGGTLSTILGHLEQILSLKMAISKIPFLGQFSALDTWPFIALKTVPIDQNWLFFGPGRSIGICKDVSKCLLMQSRQFKGPKLGQSKNSHFPADIHKVKSRISSNGKCHP